MKRRLSVAEAVRAGSILYEWNSKPVGVLALARQAELPCSDPGAEKALLREWRAFVHAAVLYGLMIQAPNIVVVEYLRVTQDMLRHEGYTPDEAERFVDEAFRAYVEPLLRTQTKECPAVFFGRLIGRELADVPPRAAAVVSGVMAMIFAAVLDKLEQYEFAAE